MEKKTRLEGLCSGCDFNLDCHNCGAGQDMYSTQDCDYYESGFQGLEDATIDGIKVKVMKDYRDEELIDQLIELAKTHMHDAHSVFNENLDKAAIVNLRGAIDVINEKYINQL